MFWRSSERAIRGCVRSALGIAREQGYRSIAFPLIGAGTGGYPPEKVLEIMQDEAGQTRISTARFGLSDSDGRRELLHDAHVGSASSGWPGLTLRVAGPGQHELRLPRRGASFAERPQLRVALAAAPHLAAELQLETIASWRHCRWSRSADFPPRPGRRRPRQVSRWSQSSRRRDHTAAPRLTIVNKMGDVQPFAAPGASVSPPR